MGSDLQNVFFNENHFAYPAIYRPSAGEPVNISVIYDNRYTEVEFQEAAVQSRQITVLTRETGLPVNYARDPGARLTVFSWTFTILIVKPDGAGVVELVLHRGVTG